MQTCNQGLISGMPDDIKDSNHGLKRHWMNVFISDLEDDTSPKVNVF